MPRLTEVAPKIRAAILLYYQGDYAIGLTARRMKQDEETGLELIDSLAEAKNTFGRWQLSSRIPSWLACSYCVVIGLPSRGGIITRFAFDLLNPVSRDIIHEHQKWSVVWLAADNLN